MFKVYWLVFNFMLFKLKLKKSVLMYQFIINLIYINYISQFASFQHYLIFIVL